MMRGHPAKQNKKNVLRNAEVITSDFHCTQSADSNHSDIAIQRLVQRWVLFAYFW